MSIESAIREVREVAEADARIRRLSDRDMLRRMAYNTQLIADALSLASIVPDSGDRYACFVFNAGRIRDLLAQIEEVERGPQG